MRNINPGKNGYKANQSTPYYAQDLPQADIRIPNKYDAQIPIFAL